MHAITRWYIKARNWQRGQTMTEYALILATVGVIAFLGYQTMGTTITTLLGTIDTSL
jgi:Flp pilus assembly pilin Flp